MREIVGAINRTTAVILSAWLAFAATAAAQTTQPLPGLNEEQTAKLIRCRAIIENPADSEATRCSQAEELIQTGWPPAVDIIAELLSTVGDGASAGIVARAISNVGRDHPERLSTKLVEPLLRLVSEGDAGASSAASAALSCFRHDQVIGRLGTLAADRSLPLRVRLAAIDSLAPNIDQRAAIAQLMPLLGASEPEVMEKALVALAPAARRNHGRNLDDWRKWWDEKRQLDETAWLRDRLDLVSQRSRDLQAQLNQLRREQETRYSALAKRLGDLLRLSLRLTPQQSQRDELLVGWLRDPLIDLRLAAVNLLSEQIYDQQKPSEAVRAALRERYADSSVEVRKAALELVGALGDPADLDPILLRLAVEHDVDVRETLFGVLGKLRNPAAIDVLIDEIADETALSNCVTRAAQSLSILARESADPALLARAVGPLHSRLARLEGADSRARGALLSAMASVGAPEFSSEFVAHLNLDDPELLLPAMRGLIAVGHRGESVRLRALLAHDDPRVRARACEAVGALGGETADLEAILARLSPARESNDVARAAAWTAYLKLARAKPADVRLAWSDRLKDILDKQAEYLAGLVEDLAAVQPPPAELPQARQRLAKLLLEQKRYAEAARHLEDLYQASATASDPSAAQTGLLLLDAVLRSGKHERLDDLLPRLAPLGDDVRSGVVQTISAYLSEASKSNDTPGLPELVSRLERVSDGLYGEEFKRYLMGIKTRLSSPPSADSGPKT